jgi:beta-phosphoglucomutase family hydrolase
MEDKMTGLTNTKAAVIFDMDGVIVDSARYHYLTWCTMLRRRGREYPWEEFQTNFGRRTDMQVRRILGDISDVEIAAFVKEKDILFREIVGQEIVAFPGVIDLIRALKHGGNKIAVGSSSPKETVHLIVSKLGVKDEFDTIVCGSEVTEGKPSPQIFLLAAKKMGVEPADCVVIEDAEVGVTAAKKGGMRAVAVTNTVSRAALKEADLVVESLTELSPNTLECLCHATKPIYTPAFGLGLKAI